VILSVLLQKKNATIPPKSGCAFSYSPRDDSLGYKNTTPMELGFFRQIESKDLNFLRKDFGGVVSEKMQQSRQNPALLFFIHRGMTSSATDMPLLRGLE